MKFTHLPKLSSLLIVLLFSQIAFAQTSSLEIVFDKDDHQFSGSHPSQLISVYNNKTLLVAGHKNGTKTKPGYIRIFKSDDQGKSWDTLFNIVADSFGFITEIYQTGDSQVVVINSKLREDTISMRWKPKYFMSFSNDLCKTWTEYDLNMPLSSKPWYLDVSGSEVVFLTNDNKETIVWQSKNRGKDWSQYPLGILKYGTIQKVNDNEYALFSDSILYVKNLKNPSISAESGDYEGYHGLNVIFKNRDTLWSANPVPSGIGNLSKTVLVKKTKANDWETDINLLEDEKHIWSRRGLFQNTFYKDEMMCFLGPNLFYTSLNNGKTWQPFYGIDSLFTGSRGVVCIKDEKSGNYHVFYTLAGEALVVKYTIQNPTSIIEHPTINPISVYPNPSKGSLNIQIQGVVSQTLTYSIYSQNGQQMDNGQINTVNGQGVVNHRLHTKGVYLLKVYNESRIYREVFLIE